MPRASRAGVWGGEEEEEAVLLPRCLHLLAQVTQRAPPPGVGRAQWQVGRKLEPQLCARLWSPEPLSFQEQL